ncbi:MAG: hypothetical protein H0X24_00320 [Ktedonobacterales bacterium]|nr:hypothetical protein [Ktedonobacterales bacterium]
MTYQWMRAWRFYDRVYHVIVQGWWQLFGSLILGTLAADLLFGGTQSIGDPRSWWFVRVGLVNWPYLVVLAPPLAVLWVLAWYGHHEAHPRASAAPVQRFPVRRLRVAQDGPALGLGYRSPPAYFPWPGYQEAILQLRHFARSGGILVLTGVSGVGKTRMAFEAVRQSLPRSSLIPLDTHVVFADLDLQPGEQIVLWLDDLAERGATDQDAKLLTRLVRHAAAQLKIGRSLIVVATCTTAELPTVQARYRSLLRDGVFLDVAPVLPEEPHWLAFLGWAKSQQLPHDAAQFDGTPGSLILDLAARVGAYQGLAGPARAILDVVALFYACGIGNWTRARVQQAATVAFDLAAVAWPAGLTALLADRWLLSRGAQVQVPIAAYLTRVLPRVGHSLDTPILQDALHRLILWHATAAGRDRIRDLYALSDALAAGVGAFADASELRQACLTRALDLQAADQETPLWAGGQQRLGELLATEEDHPAAIVAFRQALRGYPLAQYPVEHGSTLVDLGNSFKEEGSPADIEEAIACYQAALAVFTPPDFPVEHAEIQTTLADTFHQRYAQARHPEDLDHSIASMQEALTVMPREADADTWAQRQDTLGDYYRERAFWHRGDEAQAVVAYEQALSVYSPERTLLRWAETATELGEALRRRRKGGVLANVRQAQEVHRRVLQFVTRERQFWLWANASHQLGQDYASEAAHVRDRDQQSALLRQAVAVYDTVREAAVPGTFFAGLIAIDLGAVAQLEERWEDALAWFDQAAAIFAPEQLHANAHNWGLAQAERGECFAALAEQARRAHDGARCHRYRTQAIQAYSSSSSSYLLAHSLIGAEGAQTALAKMHALACALA